MGSPKDDTERKGDDELLTSRQTWEMLGVGRSTLFRMVDEGTITPVPSNPTLIRPKRIYFTRSEVERVKREGRKPKA